MLDAAPQYPIRAFVSYVSPMAQFTPKTVETAEERHNLTFRVKLQIPRERLRQFEALVKTGSPGMGYVRWDDGHQWPAKLQPAAMFPPTCGSRRRVIRAPRRARVEMDGSARSPATAPWVARVSGVSQRYGGAVALDDVTLDIPSQQDDRHDRPRRRRQVDPAGHARGRPQDPGRRGARCSAATSPTRSFRNAVCRADRLPAAGLGQEPLSDALDLRERRLLRPAVRPVARGARVADRRSFRQHRPRRRSATARPASCRAA